MPPSVIESALLAVLDKRNHPMLIHCNKGKVRSPRLWKGH
jgi:tyrosine-protein phosphatase SIW14